MVFRCSGSVSLSEHNRNAPKLSARQVLPAAVPVFRFGPRKTPGAERSARNVSPGSRLQIPEHRNTASEVLESAGLFRFRRAATEPEHRNTGRRPPDAASRGGEPRTRVDCTRVGVDFGARVVAISEAHHPTAMEGTSRPASDAGRERSCSLAFNIKHLIPWIAATPSLIAPDQYVRVFIVLLVSRFVLDVAALSRPAWLPGLRIIGDAAAKVVAQRVRVRWAARPPRRGARHVSLPNPRRRGTPTACDSRQSRQTRSFESRTVGPGPSRNTSPRLQRRSRKKMSRRRHRRK
jgi:hypothetical protein